MLIQPKRIQIHFLFFKKETKLFYSNKTEFLGFSCGSPLGEHCFSVIKHTVEAFCKL